MHHPIKIVSAALLLICIASGTFAADTHVNASLIANVRGIRAAKPFAIGVFLEIDPGWHIYWSNPGDAGLATKIVFKSPEGFTVTPDPLPVPRRFQQTGNEVVYGYENGVLITAQVTPPADFLIGDEVTFEAAASWLACKEQCVPGKAAVSLTLKSSDHANPANIMPFERYASIVTPALLHSPNLADVQAALDAATHVATVRVHWKNAVTSIEVFPAAEDAVKISQISVKKTENDVTPITLKIEPISGQTPAADRLTILIAYRDAEGHVRGFETRVPLK